VSRDPFRPQNPWKAEWRLHTERYPNRVAPGLRDYALSFARWGVAITFLVENTLSPG
jgi:hypothetical protein